MAPGDGTRGLRTLFAKAFHLKPSEKPSKRSRPGTSGKSSTDGSGRVQYEKQISRSPSPTNMVHHREVLVDSQLGENQDNTVLLHSLVYNDDVYDDIRTQPKAPAVEINPRDHIISQIPLLIWDSILEHLTPFEAASLAFSSKSLLLCLGLGPWHALDLSENYKFKINFLLTMDQYLPNHLLCFLCSSYHYRIQLGRESLKPAVALNPLYECRKAFELPFPRTRITPRRNLPFSFVQLITRAERYGPAYGIPADSLVRRWKEDHWSHQTLYAVINGHLYMRVSSSCFAQDSLSQSEVRLLLFSREDYSPYFSACAHWRDGMLMELCKCALSHIPKPRDPYTLQNIGQRVSDKLHQRLYDPRSLTILCDACKPMRRCPDCPSEYLIDLKHMEDRPTNTFKRAIMVTRWCDLGDGSSPMSPEWAAGNGELEGYDSIAAIGKRSISGMFEAHFTQDHIPGQRILNLNPMRERHSHDDPNWY